jgi:hypothetical protein
MLMEKPLKRYRNGAECRSSRSSFFVFDNKYAVSGAQHIETFVKTLEKVWKKAILNPKLLY